MSILIIGRSWKFVEFVIPTIQSILQNTNISKKIILLDNKSSRSDIIEDYYEQLYMNHSVILNYVMASHNLYSKIWYGINPFLEYFKHYKYVCFADLDVKILDKNNATWLNDLIAIASDKRVGAVTIEPEPMPPASNGFPFINLSKSHKDIPNFYPMPADTGFATSRMELYLQYISEGGFLPGSCGFHDWLISKGLLVGRTNIQFYHYGWLRSSDEYREAYKETGINFTIDNLNQDNKVYTNKQKVGTIPDIPDESYFKIRSD